MTLSSYFAFIFMASLLVISPGPNGVIVLKTLGQHGYKASLKVILGLFCATFGHGLMVLFGLSTLLLLIPEAFFIIKVLGAIYLGYLGVKALRECLFYEKTESDDVKIRDTNFWRVGFLTQILNPKVSAFYLAVIPNFIDMTSNTAKLDTLLLTLTHASMVSGWFVLVATVSVRVLPYLKNTSIGRWLNGLSGAVMLYFSGMLLTYEMKK